VKLKREKTWFDRALDHPAGAFASPEDVIEDDRLDAAGKRAVLSAWEADVRREGLAGAETPELVEVLAAIAALDRQEGSAGAP
jgi:hypothetical protein